MGLFDEACHESAAEDKKSIVEQMVIQKT